MEGNHLFAKSRVSVHGKSIDCNSRVILIIDYLLFTTANASEAAAVGCDGGVL